MWKGEELLEGDGHRVQERVPLIWRFLSRYYFPQVSALLRLKWSRHETRAV